MSSLETSQVLSRSQISCHLGSMDCGSNRRSLMRARRLARGARPARRGRARNGGGARMSESTLKGAIAETGLGRTGASLDLPAHPERIRQIDLWSDEIDG